MVNFQVARRESQRGLRLIHGVIEVASGEKGSRHPVKASRQLGLDPEGLAIAALRLLEEPCRPQRIAIERNRLGVERRGLDQHLGFAARRFEFGDPQRRLDEPGPRLAHQRRIVGLQGILIRLERIAVPAVVEEQVAQLELDFGRL